MGVIIESLGAFIVAMMLTILVLQMQFYVFDIDAETKIAFAVQSSSEIFRQVLRDDIKAVGYNLTNLTTCITQASATGLTFLTDLDEDKKADQVSISLTRTFPPKYRHNPLAIRIEKNINNNITDYDIRGLYQLEFKYFDKDSKEITSFAAADLKKIKIISFKYSLLSMDPLKYGEDLDNPNNYAIAIGEEKIFLKNIWDW